MLKKKKIILFEAFAGIGSQHQALKNLWYEIEIVWISDWYIDAILAYGINHLQLIPQKINKIEILNFLKKYSLSLDSKKPAKNLSNLSENKLSILYQVLKQFWDLDIRNISGEKISKKQVDLFTYSFPCQDISQQWKQKWFSKNSQSRSWLLWEIERILKEIHAQKNTKNLPKVLLMENVKALLNENFKQDLDEWIKELEALWYISTKPFVINASDLWESQKRERVFMISYLWKKPPEFKISKNHKNKFITDIFEENIFHEIFETQKNIEIIEIKQKTWIKKSFLKWYSNFNAENFVYFKDGKSPTITASWAQSRIKIFHNDQIIYLNAFEHLKLQWFHDEIFYENLKDIWITENKIKFLAWNSINIKVLEEIFNFYL